MASLLDAKSPLAQLLEQFSIGKHDRKIDIRKDESYIDNVKFITETFGDNVEIMEPDMPPIHDGCGLVIGEKGEMAEMDKEMKMAIEPAMDKVRAVQQKQGNFISWSQMQSIFDDELHAVFTPVVGDDKHKMDHLGEDEGFSLAVPGSQVDPMRLQEAEKKMKEVIGDVKVWNMLKIDTEALKKMFASIGTSRLIGSENVAKIAIDCGVIRFPIADDPFFKLYRFRVIAVKITTQVVIVRSNAFNGLFMTYDERKYRASDTWTSKWKDVAVKKVDDIFEAMMAKYS